MSYNPSAVKLVDVDLHEEAEKYRKEQQESLIIDFDEAVREEQSKAVKIKFQGKLYELPKSAPAWLPLFVNRHAKNGVLNDEQNLKLIEGLLGKEFSDKIVDEQNNFVSFELVNDKILTPVMEMWGISGTENVKK